MYTKIDVGKFIDKFALTFEKNKTYSVGYSLTLAQTRNKKLFFCRSIVLYNHEDYFVYDFISEKVLPFIDLKKDSKLINYEPIFECIREQEINNLKKNLNEINIQNLDEDEILQDLHNLPMLKTFPVEREYAIALNGMPYIKIIPYILKSKYLPSLKISNRQIIFNDKDLFNLDEQLYIEKTSKKENEKTKKINLMKK